MASRNQTSTAPDLGAAVVPQDNAGEQAPSTTESGDTGGDAGAESQPPVDTPPPGTDDNAAPVETVALIECDVLVKRDIACVIATTVYGHEIPVLAAAHGPDNIEVKAERVIQVAGFNVVAEFDRLRRKYNDKNRDPLKEALPLGLRSLEELTGVYATPHAQRVEALVKLRELPPVRNAP